MLEIKAVLSTTSTTRLLHTYLQTNTDYIVKKQNQIFLLFYKFMEVGMYICYPEELD